MTTKINFANGGSIPTVGLGTCAPLQGEEEIITSVKAAVKAGYRHIDCAAIYRNERAVGHALKELFVMGIVKREDLFITSKLWNTCHKSDLVLPSLKKTLDDLGLEYVDLYLVHWPMAYKEGGELNPVDENGKTLFSEVHFSETWQALEDCQDMGLVKHIGLSNFNASQIDSLWAAARIKPVALQIEINCHNTNRKLIEHARAKGLTIVGFAPLGTPCRVDSHTRLIDEPVVQEIAKSVGKTPAQVALRFLIEQDIVVIPKSVTPKRIEENVKVFDFKLSNSDMEKLFALNKNYRVYEETIALDHPLYPFHVEF